MWGLCFHWLLCFQWVWLVHSKEDRCYGFNSFFSTTAEVQLLQLTPSHPHSVSLLDVLLWTEAMPLHRFSVFDHLLLISQAVHSLLFFRSFFLERTQVKTSFFFLMTTSDFLSWIQNPLVESEEKEVRCSTVVWEMSSGYVVTTCGSASVSATHLWHARAACYDAVLVGGCQVLRVAWKLASS